MLVLDVSINREELIDTILIHRIKTGKNGINTYRIVKPVGFEKQLIKHRYADLYMPLLKAALDIILAGKEKL
jgi:hypothetical protein